MIKINIIKDGNFTQWFCLLLAVVGIGFMYCAVKLVGSSIWGGVLFLLGLGIAVTGGYASRAALLHIKPFENNWRKVRKSYEVKDSDQDKSS